MLRQAKHLFIYILVFGTTINEYGDTLGVRVLYCNILGGVRESAEKVHIFCILA